MTVAKIDTPTQIGNKKEGAKCLMIRNACLHQKSAKRNQMAPMAGILANNREVCPSLPEPNREAIIHFGSICFWRIIAHNRSMKTIITQVNRYGNKSLLESFLIDKNNEWSLKKKPDIIKKTGT